MIGYAAQYKDLVADAPFGGLKAALCKMADE